jgi:hypothetical protein
VSGPGHGESGQGLDVIIGFSDFKEVMCVIRVSSFRWVFTSCYDTKRVSTVK